MTKGSQAAHAWYLARGLPPPSVERWNVEVALSTLDVPTPELFDERIDTRFHIDVYGEEWGFFFCHGGQTSWIRVTDVSFVHGRDDFGLLARTPELAEIGAFLREIEERHQLSFRRKHALVRTNLSAAEPAIRRWIDAL